MEIVYAGDRATGRLSFSPSPLLERCFVARQDQVRNQAAYVLGNARLASAWLTRPALGLDRRCPCSLLVDPDSYRQVGQYLTRIEHGVY